MKTITSERAILSWGGGTHEGTGSESYHVIYTDPSGIEWIYLGRGFVKLADQKNVVRKEPR